MAIIEEKRQLNTHDELCFGLIKHLNDYVCYFDAQIRGVRPDILALKPTYNLNQFHAVTYEVKVSRADFLQDVKAGKYKSYFGFSRKVYFACPEGIVTLCDVPEDCGLIVYKNGFFEIVKNACILDGQLTMMDMMSLVLRSNVNHKCYCELKN